MALLILPPRSTPAWIVSANLFCGYCHCCLPTSMCWCCGRGGGLRHKPRHKDFFSAPNSYCNFNILLVGAGRFERPTPCAQGRCATRLRYAPTCGALLILNHFLSLRYVSRDKNSSVSSPCQNRARLFAFRLLRVLLEYLRIIAIPTRRLFHLLERVA
jgi:hypothetical protein